MKVKDPSDPKIAFEMGNWLQLCPKVLAMRIVAFSSVGISHSLEYDVQRLLHSQSNKNESRPYLRF